MTDKLRIRIAAGATALFLAVISAAGLAVRHDGAAGSAAMPAAQPAAAVGSTQPVVAQRSEDNERYEDESPDEEGGEHD